MTLEERIEAHGAVFGFGTLHVVGGRIEGLWMTGQNFKNKSKLYGAYPPRFLRRIRAMFPDPDHVVHLFSGSVEKGLWNSEQTVDINPEHKPDVVADAHKLGPHLLACDLLIADPPYTAADAERYGTKMIYRKAVVHECAKVILPGGHLVWLDTEWPQFTKREFECMALIGYVRSTNHRVRLVSMYRRVGS